MNFELLEFKEPRGDPRARGLHEAGSAHLCFVADDLDAEYERLKALGASCRSPGPVTVVGGPNDGGKGLYVDDPDGNGVEIIQLARPWPVRFDLAERADAVGSPDRRKGASEMAFTATRT